MEALLFYTCPHSIWILVVKVKSFGFTNTHLILLICTVMQYQAKPQDPIWNKNQKLVSARQVNTNCICLILVTSVCIPNAS